MGEALGIHDSGILSQDDPNIDANPNEPLDKLLLNKRFRLSFMEFADRSCFHTTWIKSQNRQVGWAGLVIGQTGFVSNLVYLVWVESG